MPHSNSHAEPRFLLAIAAAAAPSLLAYNVPPSPTFWNQALGVALRVWFVVAVAPRAVGTWRAAGPLFGALALMTVSVVWSWGPGSLPAGLALSAIGLLLATGVLVAGGAGDWARWSIPSTGCTSCTSRQLRAPGGCCLRGVPAGDPQRHRAGAGRWRRAALDGVRVS